MKEELDKYLDMLDELPHYMMKEVWLRIMGIC